MTQSGTNSHAWPLLFKHHGTLLGKAFIADIEIHGRILARPEADGVWIDGVNPGAISLGAATLNDTHGIPRVDAATAVRYIKVTRKTVEAVTPKDNTIVQQESQDAYYTVYARAA